MNRTVFHFIPWLTGSTSCMQTVSAVLHLILLAFAQPLAALGDEPKQITNSIGMKLTWIPNGTFTMGSNETYESLRQDFPQYDRERLELPDEQPAHQVRIVKPFYMGVFEVTRGEFRAFVEQSGRRSDAETDKTGGYGFEPNRPLDGDAFAGRDTKYSWQNAGFEQNDRHPVVNVTWHDAVAMADWLSRKEGKRYRLPTEAEWEYACRAGSTSRYSTGNHPISLLDGAVLYDSKTAEVFPQWKQFALSASDDFQFSAPVGSKKPNAFGLYDMHGSVWEWCNDWYSEDYYSKSPMDSPTGPEDGGERVRRGGSWHTWSFYCRSSFRNYNTMESRYPLLGFRLVMEVP